MNRIAKLATPPWLGGLSFAVIGVILVRGVAPTLAGSARSTVEFTGEILALGGLAIIAWGISRRSRALPPG